MSSAAKFAETVFLDPSRTVAALRPVGSVRMDVVFGYVVFALMVLSSSVAIVRWINYAIPLVAALLLLGNRQWHMNDLAKPYLLLIGSGILLLPFASRAGIQDLYLMLVGCSAALVGFRRAYSWRTVFLACVAGQIAFMGMSAAFGRGVSLSTLQFDFGGSTSSFESTFSFVFGLLAVWAIHLRNWKAFLLASLMALLTLKRIALLGVLVCLVVQVFSRSWLDRLLKPVPMVLANVAFLSVILLYGSGFFDVWIVRWTSMSPNELGMGRQVLHQNLVREFLADPLRFSLIGMGAGDAYGALKQSSLWTGKTNLHADTLKILYEYGAVVLVLFISALFASKHRGVRLLALYINVVLLTDNTLIYPFFIYFSTLIAAMMLLEPTVTQPAAPAASEAIDER